MPATPSTYASNYPVQARQLNDDLYTYTPGNNHTPNGILFHAQPPFELQFMNAGTRTQPSSSGGTNNNMGGTAGTSGWFNWADTSVLFSIGSDYPAQYAAGVFNAQVPGANGSGGLGGVYLLVGGASWSNQTNNGVAGTVLYNGGTLYSVGGAQMATVSPSRPNTSWTLDLIKDPALGPGVTLGGFSKDASAGSWTYNLHSDPTSSTSRLEVLWVSSSFGTTTGPNSFTVPVPPAWTPSSSVTSSALNGSAIKQAMLFLNANGGTLQRPVLRTSGATSGAITANTITAVTTPASLDNLGNYASNKYTAPCDGVYLIYAMTEFTDTASSEKQAGAQIVVSGPTTFNLMGPAQSTLSTVSPCRPQMARLVGLRQGDTVQLVAQDSAAGTIGTNGRLIVLFMSAIAPTDGAWSWTPPDTGYRWQAGNQSSPLPNVVGALPALWQQHLTNDVSFLLQRPYLMAYQTVQQAGLASNTGAIITMDTLGSRVHTEASGIAGDSYGGWHSGTSNYYAAPVPGWYLAMHEVHQVGPGTTSIFQCEATILCQDSAGTNQGTDSVLQSTATRSATLAPGATAIGFFYLDAGDRLVPRYTMTDGTTWSTYVATAGQESSFGVVWVSE